MDTQRLETADFAKALKAKAAAKALELIEDGMRIGIGTGSTANEFIRLLSLNVAQGLNVCGVPTSQRSADLCQELAVPTASLAEMPELDIAIDGADEIGPKLALIKGGGGALLYEKIVAAAAQKFVVIADDTKLVDHLGQFPLPVEVNTFGLRATENAVRKALINLGLTGETRLRENNGKPFVSDGGHYILDVSLGRILDPKSLSEALFAIPGVVEHGLFLEMASHAVVSAADGTVKLISA